MTLINDAFYVSIGNSDDKLTQQRWSEFQSDLRHYVLDEELAGNIQQHGVWYSSPTTPYQNMCICFTIPEGVIAIAVEHDMKEFLRGLAQEYGQNSIAWAEARTTFLS